MENYAGMFGNIMRKFCAKKCPKDAEDAEVGELCGSATLHPVRCPASGITRYVLYMYLTNYHDECGLPTCDQSATSVLNLRSLILKYGMLLF